MIVQGSLVLQRLSMASTQLPPADKIAFYALRMGKVYVLLQIVLIGVDSSTESAVGGIIYPFAGIWVGERHDGVRCMEVYGSRRGG